MTVRYILMAVHSQHSNPFSYHKSANGLTITHTRVYRKYVNFDAGILSLSDIVNPLKALVLTFF